MYVLHAKFVITEGNEALYERWKVDEALIQLRAPGFVKRLVLKDRDHRGVYYYVTFWETEEQMQTFSHSEELAAMLELYGSPSSTFAVPGEFARVDVLADEGRVMAVPAAPAPSPAGG